MTSLIAQLSDIVGQAFGDEGLDKSFGLVRFSDRPDLAQFQCNGAMAAAKAAKKNPRTVAETIIQKLQSNPDFSKIEIAGPGFINLTLTDEALGNYISLLTSDDRCGVEQIGHNETIMLDYGGPNVAKPMHVGHLRSSIIGDSIRRILQFSGYNTVGDIHMGDWGTQMGMMISELEIMHPDWVYFDENYTGDYPIDTVVTMEDFEEIYPRVSALCKTDPERLERSKKAVVDLQNKRRGYYALWQQFVAISLHSMKRNFTALNVHFDLWKGETDVHDLIAPMVDDLQKRGYAIEDEGAIVVHVKKNDDNKEFPPLILYKSDGGVLYGTTDLATIVERVRDYNPARILYVVDKRQGLHFEQVFRAAKLTGIAPEQLELTHLGYGTMNGQDGKPFKTRAGGVLKLEDMISMGQEKALQRIEEAEAAKGLSQNEKDDIAMKVAIAAIKFADLQNSFSADYVFDLDRMTSFEGKTGPYLLYQSVRIKSLLEKADYKTQKNLEIIPTDADRNLILALIELPQVVDVAVRNYTPHVLCDHAYKLAQTFSSFYGNTHIMSESDPVQRQIWLELSHMVLMQLELLLDLVGIKIPERM
ncbi:MAG: arginine--tRNA ligase [Alphaproteobacteria bacterium]|nr:arginine--tRNA ligase [Alphaproteobacteria bacterium]